MPALTPPPAISVPAPPDAGVRLVNVVSFEPGGVVCDGQQVEQSGIVKPFSTVVTRYGSAPIFAERSDYGLSFDIDPHGRPRTIRKTVISAFPGYYLDTSDLAPSLAASRFKTGQSRRGCSITYRVVATPVTSTPLPTLYELASRPEPSASITEVMDRVRSFGSGCPRGPGPFRRLNQPAFEKIPQKSGAWSWTFLAYDVDESGKTENTRVLGSSGNAALDQASVKSLAANRYAPGPGVRGCTYHFYRVGPADDVAPQLPAETPADNGELPACSIDPKTIRSLLEGSAYPKAFSRRRIEGIAAVSYDTAPWGAIGNIKVIASEPDEAFGEAAQNALMGAKVLENDVGHRGCHRRIRFKLPLERPS